MTRCVSPPDQAPSPVLTIEDLKAAWGQTDSIYDLDQDGIVNVNDLMQLLAERAEVKMHRRQR